MSKRTSRGLAAIIIGERGETRIKDFFLGWEWLARPLSSTLDQGIDLMVEVAKDGRGTGVHFIVQCRATADQKIKNGHHRTTLKANTLAYLQKQRAPVFIMRPSPKGNEIYWTSLEQALRGTTRNRDGGVTVKIPTEGSFLTLSEGAAVDRYKQVFISEMRRVDPTLKGFYTQGAILEQEQALVAIDSRLDVKIVASSQGRSISVSAKEPVDLKATVSFSDKIEALKFQDALYYGTEATVAFSQLTMVGSPLFEQLTTQGESGVLTVGSEQLDRVDIKVGAPRRDGPQTGMLTMHGHFTQGIKGAQLVAQSLRHPLTSVLKFEKDIAERGLRFTLRHQVVL